MAETTGAAPRRTRATTTKPAVAKAAPAKAPAKAATPKPVTATPEYPVKLELVHSGSTANYEKFTYGNRGDAVICSVYAPSGTTRVLVAVLSDEAPATE